MTEGQTERVPEKEPGEGAGTCSLHNHADLHSKCNGSRDSFAKSQRKAVQGIRGTQKNRL